MKKKYKTKILLTTNELLELKFDGYTYQSIADEAGVSRQRIQQLLSPTKATRNIVFNRFNNRCKECNIFVGESGHIHHISNNVEDYHNVENLILLCISCHRKLHRRIHYCFECGQENKGNGFYFCSRGCYSKYHTSTLTCSYCEKLFELSTSLAYKRIELSQSGRIFCNNACKGLWLADNYGFAIYPEHQRKGMNKKWDYNQIYNTRENTGFGALRLSRLLNIPVSTISMILRKEKENNG